MLVKIGMRIHYLLNEADRRLILLEAWDYHIAHPLLNIGNASSQRRVSQILITLALLNANRRVKAGDFRTVFEFV